jgi:uncharacterized protein (DUF433 family)
MTTASRVRGTHVERRTSVCGGAPVVRGTRFPVRAVADYVLRLGWTPEVMVREWKHLTLARVHGALAYYYDHRTEIDRDLRRQERAFRRASGA